MRRLIFLYVTVYQGFSVCVCVSFFFINEAWYDLCKRTPVHVGFGKENNCTWEEKIQKG